MLEDEDVVTKRDRVLELEVLVVDLVEVAARLADQVEVETGVIRPVAKAGDHRLGRGLGGAPGQRREGGVDASGAGFDRREVRKGRGRGGRGEGTPAGQLG